MERKLIIIRLLMWKRISGHGVSATVGGKEILAGNAKLMKK